MYLTFSMHPFAKKEWYNVLVPVIFDNRNPTVTPCNKTAGQSKRFWRLSFPLENSADSLRGRVFDISLADLNRDSNENQWRKVQLQIEEIKGSEVYTNFYGLSVTRDKLCQLVKKWHSLVEAFVQAKTTDGYLLRLACVGFTKRTAKQVKATCYAKNS